MSSKQAGNAKIITRVERTSVQTSMHVIFHCSCVKECRVKLVTKGHRWFRLVLTTATEEVVWEHETRKLDDGGQAGTR